MNSESAYRLQHNSRVKSEHALVLEEVFSGFCTLQFAKCFADNFATSHPIRSVIRLIAEGEKRRNIGHYSGRGFHCYVRVN
jgi:hypothetical protein